jgi:hypothetical protein
LIVIVIPVLVEGSGDECFDECRSLSFVKFESVSRLSLVEKWAFSQTGLIQIVIPASVEILDEE